MEPSGICILVVNQDTTCCTIVAEMLETCSYEVLHVGKPLETLSTICDRKDKINLVLTNLHRIQAQGTNDILHHIQKTLNLPTYLMSPDDAKVEVNGQESSFAAYLLNSFNISEINTLWEVSSANNNAFEENNKPTEGSKKESPQATAPMAAAASSPRNNILIGSRENAPSSPGIGSKTRRKRKGSHRRVYSSSDDDESGDDDEFAEKKPRVIWTDELHKKFLDAMELIRPEKPVPKRIVEIMNVPGLRRENVASHLQKYRIVLKKAEEKARAFNSGINLGHHLGELSFPSYAPSLDLNFTQANSPAKNLPFGKGMAPFLQGPSSLMSSLAATRKQPFSVNNPRLSSHLLSLRQSNLLAGNDRKSLQQQPSDPNSPSSNQSLMPQKSNCLPSAYPYGLGNTFLDTLSSDPGSNSMSDPAKTGSSLRSFTGLRLTNGGMTLEFGLTRVPVGDDNGKELFPPSEVSASKNRTLNHLISGTENQQSLDHSPHSNSRKIEVLQVPPPSTFPEQNSSSQTHISENNCSSFDSISQLVKSLEDNMINSPSVPVDPSSTIKQHHHPLPQDSTTAANDEALHGAPRLVDNILPLQQQEAFLSQFGTLAMWDSSVHQNPPLPASGEQQPSPFPGNDHFSAALNSILADQPQIPAPESGCNTIAHSSTLIGFQQENDVPFSGNPGQEPSIQEPPGSNQALDEAASDSSWPCENFSSFLNETGSSNTPSLWDGDFEDTFFSKMN